MEWMLALVGVLILGAAGLAVYERIKGKSIISARRNNPLVTSEADRDAERARDVFDQSR